MDESLISAKPGRPRGLAPGCAVSLALAGPAVLALFAVLSEEPQWQSGEFSAYATLVLRNSIYVFAPLMFYSTSCLALAAYRREAALAYFVIRFGVYSGILISVQPVVLYIIVAVGAASGGPEAALIFAGLMALGSAEIFLPLSMAWVIKDSASRRARWTLGISAATLIAVTLLIGPALFVIAPVVAAPLWTIMVYVADRVPPPRRPRTISFGRSDRPADVVECLSRLVAAVGDPGARKIRHIAKGAMSARPPLAAIAGWCSQTRYVPKMAPCSARIARCGG